MRNFFLIIGCFFIIGCNTKYRITNKELSKFRIYEYQNILGTLEVEIELKNATIRRNRIKMSGFVREIDSKEGLEGVTIFLKNGLKRRIKLNESSLDGYFSIDFNVIKNDTLSFSLIGYKSLNFLFGDKYPCSFYGKPQ